MKRIRIEAFCDNPLTHDEEDEVPAVVERTLTMDDSGPRLVDVCEPCDRMLDLVRALIGRGVTPEQMSAPLKKGRPSLPLDCREPGCIDPRTGVPYVGSSRSALGTHVKDSHGKSLRDYDWTTPAPAST